MSDDASRREDALTSDHALAPDDDAAKAKEDVAKEAAREDVAKEIETKLELVGAVALLSVTAVVRALQARAPGELPEEQRQALVQVRDELRTALERVDAQLATGRPAGLDLSGLREKLARTLQALEQWPVGNESLPS
jgi:hypothetical protein